MWFNIELVFIFIFADLTPHIFIWLQSFYVKVFRDTTFHAHSCCHSACNTKLILAKTSRTLRRYTSSEMLLGTTTSTTSKRPQIIMHYFLNVKEIRRWRQCDEEMLTYKTTHLWLHQARKVLTVFVEIFFFCFFSFLKSQCIIWAHVDPCYLKRIVLKCCVRELDSSIQGSGTCQD